MPLSVLNHQRRAMLPDSPNPKKVQYVALRKVVHLKRAQHIRGAIICGMLRLVRARCIRIVSRVAD